MTNPKNEKVAAPICQCGCEAQTKGGRYLPGHDAKHKSALVSAAVAGSKRAANKLEHLGWSKFLEAKLAKQGAKATPAETVVPEVEKPRRGRKKAQSPTEDSNQFGAQQEAVVPADESAVNEAN